jgi:DNA-binding transcriptional regulator YhcF (GntR family)
LYRLPEKRKGSRVTGLCDNPRVHIWLARNTGIPVREQLVTQVVLAILSGDLREGQRLPSTRELARRFRVHANTVSAAYRELEEQQWVESRRGSGVFVRDGKQRPEYAQDVPELALNKLIAGFFRSARKTGVPLSVVRTRMRQWLAMQPPDQFLLIEPDEELRRIVAFEMRQAVDFPVTEAGLDACERSAMLEGAIVVALPSKLKVIRGQLPSGVECFPLKVRSAQESLGPWLPARKDLLVAIASRWDGFLRPAKTMLVAAGFHVDSLLLCDARKPRWKTAVRQAAAVICDPLTAQSVPQGCRIIPFRVLADTALAELRAHRDFVCRPLLP